MAGEARATVGQILKARRVERGLDLARIADETRIPMRYLTALEDDRHADLPAYAYALGFLRNYARLLSLSADDIVAQFKNEALPPSLSEASFSEPEDESRLPARGLALGGLAAAALVAGAWIWWSGRSAAPPPPPPAAAEGADALAETLPPSGEMLPEPAPASTDAPPPEAGPAAAATGDAAVGIVVRALEDSWIKVSDGGPKALRIGVLKAGETYRVPDQKGLLLTTGNAGGIEIIADGKTLPPLGDKGTIVRNRGIDRAALGLGPPPAPAGTTPAGLPGQASGGQGPTGQSDGSSGGPAATAGSQPR